MLLFLSFGIMTEAPFSCSNLNVTFFAFRCCSLTSLTKHVLQSMAAVSAPPHLSSPLLWFFLSLCNLPSYSIIAILKCQSYINVVVFNFTLPEKWNHTLLFPCVLLYQWNSHIKLVTLLITTQKQWTSTRLEWGKVNMVNICHIFHCCQWGQWKGFFCSLTLVCLVVIVWSFSICVLLIVARGLTFYLSPHSSVVFMLWNIFPSFTAAHSDIRLPVV